MKLQPNFSWQKYDNDNDQAQFQYQLQREHILVANSINSTIDDLSYFTTERKTGLYHFGSVIYTKSFSGVLTAAGISVAHGVTGLNVIVHIHGTVQDVVPLTSGTLAYNVDHASMVLANRIHSSVTPTNIIITAGAPYTGWAYQITMEYTKV